MRRLPVHNSERIQFKWHISPQKNYRELQKNEGNRNRSMDRGAEEKRTMCILTIERYMFWFCRFPVQKILILTYCSLKEGGGLDGCGG